MCSDLKKVTDVFLALMQVSALTTEKVTHGHVTFFEGVYPLVCHLTIPPNICLLYKFEKRIT